MKASPLAIACLLLVAVSAESLASADGTELSQTQSSLSVRKRDLQKVEAGCNKGALNQLVLDLPLVAYPPEAARRNIGGKVTIKVFVDESGRVYYAIPIGGPSLLRKASLRSARQARFAPFIKDEKPIKCSGNLIYTFNPPKPRGD